MARIKSILKRVNATVDPALSNAPKTYRGLVLDPGAYSCEFNNQRVSLTPVEFRMLSALAKQPGQVVRREELCAQAYEDHRIVSVQTVNTHIKNLRRKLNDVSSDGDLIHSVYGVGYKLE